MVRKEVVVSGSVVTFIRRFMSLPSGSLTFNANAVVSTIKLRVTEVSTYILLYHLVEFHCQMCQIQEHQLAGSCATCMPKTTLNEELNSRKVGGRRRKRWIRDVDEDARMMIIGG